MSNLLTLKQNFLAQYAKKEDLQKMRASISKNGGVVYITFKELLNKYPKFAPLASFTAFKLFETKQKTIEIFTLTLKSFEGKLVAVLPDFQNSKIDVDVIDFNPRLKQATIKLKDVELVVAVSLSDLGSEFSINSDFKTLIKGDDIDIEHFDVYVPNKFIKLATLPKGVYFVKFNGNYTESNNTPLANFKPLQSDVEIENVTCDTFLQRLIFDEKTHKIEIIGSNHTKVLIAELD